MKIEQVADESALNTLAALEKDCFGDDAWTNDTLQAFLQAPIRRAYLLWDENGQALGYSVLTYFDGEAEIERLGIARAQRRKNFGKTLLALLKEKLMLKRILLDVSAHNEAAVHLYHASGFDVYSTRPAYYNDGSDALMMEWKKVSDD